MRRGRTVRGRLQKITAGRPSAGSSAHDLQTVAAGHFHVEKHEVQRRGPDQGEGFGAAAAFADDLDRGLLQQPGAQPIAGERFIIDDETRSRFMG